MNKPFSTSSKKALSFVKYSSQYKLPIMFCCRNSNKNKTIQCKHAKCLWEQENITTRNFAAINYLVTQHNWMSWMKIFTFIFIFIIVINTIINVIINTIFITFVITVIFEQEQFTALMK